MLINYQNPSNMSIRSVTRSIQDPSVNQTVLFANIEPAWIQQFPNDKFSSVQIPLNGTVRLFEAYTPNSSKDHKTWKSFEHFKAETNYAHGTSPSGITLSMDLGKGNHFLSVGNTHDDRVFNQNVSYGTQGRYNNGLTSWYVPRADGGFIPPHPDLENLKKRGLQAMLPKVKAELSSLVSLYEAKDILSLRGSIKGVTKLAKSLFSRVGGLGTRSLGKAVLRQGADGYLQWMFNLKPLISDIGGIYHAVASYERRINDLVTRSGKTQLAHYKCNLSELVGTYDEPYGPYGPCGSSPAGYFLVGGFAKYCYSQVSLMRRLVCDSAVFRSSMQFNYSYSAFQLEHAKVLGFLDALGINFNPRYVWDTIPWSFVVDWVVDIGRWLDQFEVKNLEPKVNILQYCWSITKRRRIAMIGKVRSPKFYDGPGNYGLQCIRLPEVVETSYRRGIDFPTTSSFTTSGLSSTELSLGAALLITRRRRNTKARKF